MAAAKNFQQGNLTTSLKKNAILRVSSNNTSGIREYALTKSNMHIGRATACDICIGEDVISGYHFQVEERNGLYYLLHPHPSRQETTNGFIYQGKQYRGNERYGWQQQEFLKHGDVFRIGDTSGTMVSIAFDDGSGDFQDNVPQIRDVTLNANKITLGRAQDNDVVLEHETVSAHHAVLEKHGLEYRILDLNSTNHIYINGVRQTHHDLFQNDEIQIGPFKLTYTGRLLKCDDSRSIGIEAQNLYKIVRSKGKDKLLLNNISLVIPPRKFVALVGGSGAGKSTLLKALSGLSPASGTVNYNGQDYYKSYAAFNTQLGYVPQDDIVHRELTVKSALYYGAKLRLPADYDEHQIQARMKEVLKEVELDGKEDTLITRLSGGQRKRVSIALELLANPSVFFLDEPTSGLDPGLDRKMMNLLRKLADKGQTILLVTHATNNINVCDYVCFMGHGHLVYYGPPQQAMLFFKKTDFSDIYNELENEQACQRWSEDFRRSLDYKTYISDASTIANNRNNQTVKLQKPKQGNPFLQWWFLCGRYFQLLKNDRGNLAILLLQAPLIALIIFAIIKVAIGAGGFDPNNVVQCPRMAQVFTQTGQPAPAGSGKIISKKCGELEQILETTPQGKAYSAARGGARKALQDFIVPGPGDATTIIFIIAFAAVMCGCINSSREIVKEYPIYQRERAVNIGILPYLFSKIAILGLLCLLQSLALLLIVSMADPFPHGVFLPGEVEAYITISLTSLSGLMLGLTLSALVPNSDRAMSFLPLLLLPQVIFSGMMFPFKEQIPQIISMAFPARWSMAALGSIIGLHSDKVFGPIRGTDKLLGNNESYHGTIFSVYSTADATRHLEYLWAGLIVTIIVLICITTLCLVLKDKRSVGYVRRNCVQCKRKLPRDNAQFCSACGARQFV